MVKAISIGDTLCVSDDGKVIHYVINDICIYITDNGSYDIGLFFNEIKEPTPYWMFEELNQRGLMWKLGQEKVMEVLRKKRA